jgi:hypothetical protein
MIGTPKVDLSWSRGFAQGATRSLPHKNSLPLLRSYPVSSLQPVAPDAVFVIVPPFGPFSVDLQPLRFRPVCVSSALIGV